METNLLTFLILYVFIFGSLSPADKILKGETPKFKKDLEKKNKYFPCQNRT